MKYKLEEIEAMRAALHEWWLRLSWNQYSQNVVVPEEMLERRLNTYLAAGVPAKVLQDMVDHLDMPKNPDQWFPNYVHAVRVKASFFEPSQEQ